MILLFTLLIVANVARDFIHGNAHGVKNALQLTVTLLFAFLVGIVHYRTTEWHLLLKGTLGAIQYLALRLMIFNPLNGYIRGKGLNYTGKEGSRAFWDKIESRIPVQARWAIRLSLFILFISLYL